MIKNDKTILWVPTFELIEQTNMASFIKQIEAKYELNFNYDYEKIHEWSCNNLAEFWETCFVASGIQTTQAYETVIEGYMPNVEWFKGAKINYAYEILKQTPENIALYSYSEAREPSSLTYGELKRKVISLAQYLKKIGIKKGDRVASYLPNIEETTVAMLATVSIGAIWSTAAPEFGSQTVLDCFTQISPKVIFMCDGYKFNGRKFSKIDDNYKIINQLDSVEKVVFVNYIEEIAELDYPNIVKFNDVIQFECKEKFEFEWVEHNHPLWILYSSGTTGLPKAIVHSHLGMLLESWLLCSLHLDIKEKTKIFFYTTTGWMMWNFLQGALTIGASIVLYDGCPIYPSKTYLWDIAEQLNLEVFGASPTYIQLLQKEEIILKELFKLDSLKTIIMSGSPLIDESFYWIYETIKSDLLLAPLSGGTDICGAFIGPTFLKPLIAGAMQCRMLGNDIQAWDDQGHPLIDKVGELVCRQPLPCMPLGFWNDQDGQKYYSAYFEDYPNIWKHGDFLEITSTGHCVIKGRSDATLNRYGVRIGTAEIYRVVEQVSGVIDSLVVCCELKDGGFYMPLFVQLADNMTLNENLIHEIKTELRTKCSPRHIPDEILIISEIPYTLTGKKMEIPVRKVLMGNPVNTAFNIDSMKNPKSIDYFLKLSQKLM